MRSTKWLYPGMHVKRWLLLLLLGIVLLGLGTAYFLHDVYNEGTFPTWVYYATLQFLPRLLRGVLFTLLGVGAIGLALWQLRRSLASALLPLRADDRLVDQIYYRRFLKRGPKVVVVGGGTGLSTMLRGIKEHTANVTAIVTVADDGGSSGRLRRELGVLPPGDFRNCIAALADAEPLMTKLFQYRFEEGSGLEGHSFGNLFLVAMSHITGNFEHALVESSRVLAVRGQVLPCTLSSVTLSARMDDDTVVRGESNIPNYPGRIRQLSIEPAQAQAYPEAVRALLEADLIILGPGSLYTSILPNLLVTGIQQAVRASTATKVYVCNVATQKGETDEFGVAEHAQVLREHCGQGLFRYVLANRLPSEPSPTDKVKLVGAEPGDSLDDPDLELVVADVVNEDNILRHDPRKLAAQLMRLSYQTAPARAKAESRAARGVARLAS